MRRCSECLGYRNELKKRLLGIVAKEHTLNPSKTYAAASASTLKVGEKVVADGAHRVRKTDRVKPLAK